MSQKHTRTLGERRALWWTEKLWSLAKDLPVLDVRLESIAELDQNCWFDQGHEPTCGEVAKHAKQIWEADLSIPIILSSNGDLMDGAHRVCKALLLGQSTIKACQFQSDPPPDELLQM